MGAAFLKKSHACGLLYSLLFLLILFYCLFFMGQNTPSKAECQYIGHCSNTKTKHCSLRWRACNQNRQDKAWKHGEYLKSKAFSFPFVLSKCSFSLAAQIFPPTSLNNLIFEESWNYHVLASEERPFMSFTNHSHLKRATEVGSDHSGSDGSFSFWFHNVLVMLTCHTGNNCILARHLQSDLLSGWGKGGCCVLRVQ